MQVYCTDFEELISCHFARRPTARIDFLGLLQIKALLVETKHIRILVLGLI